MLFSPSKESFKAVKKLQDPVYKVPESIQESIPVSRISKRGTFEIESDKANKMYDRIYMFEDINYKDLDSQEKADVFRSYCEFLNTMQTNFKVQVFNFNEDMQRFREQILLKHQEGEDTWRRDLVDGFNQVLENNMVEGANGILQIRFLCVTCQKESMEFADAYFDSVETNMRNYFQKVGSQLIPLDAEDRIRYLFYIYRMGHESEFDLSWSALRFRHDWKNDVAGDFMKVNKDYIEFEDKFVTMLYMSKYGANVADFFLNEMLDVPYNIGVTLDSTPVPASVAAKAVQGIAMDIEKSIQIQQQERNKIGAYTSQITYTKRKEKAEIERYMDDMHDNDANLFWTNILVMVVGETLEDMNANARNIMSIANTKGFVLRTCRQRQLEAFNSALPLGGRYVDYTRPLFTQPLAGFMPFNTQEIRHAGGFSYGINQVSHKLIVGDRKKLDNGNGFVFGVPGGGKSFFVKMEMGQVYAATNDDMIVVDPQNEYFDIAQSWGGDVIDFSISSDYYMNPFELPPISEKKNFAAFVGDQAEFGVSLIQSIMGDTMDPYHKSVVEKAIREMYEKAKQTWVHPTMMDLKKALESFEGRYKEFAEDVIVAIEPFTEGSLNIFAKQSNVDLNNRFMVFGLKELQDNLRRPAMLVMINFINKRVLYNSSKTKATWLWCDEFHVLTADETQAKEMEKCFKVFRKIGGIVTGITQNIDDMVHSKTTRTMVSNSEFLTLLKQANLDRGMISDVIEISNMQTKYVTNVDAGTGLIRLGAKVIPFNNRMSKNVPLYALFNTNLHEKAREGA